MQKNILRWFGHVMKRNDSEVLRVVMQNVERTM